MVEKELEVVPDGMISTDTMMNILVMCVLPVMASQVAILWIVRDIKKTSEKLLEMHQNPENTGFGTRLQDTILLEIRDCLRDLIHYTTQEITSRTGKTPRPREPSI